MNDYREHCCAKVMEMEIIPRFTEHGIVTKLDSGIRVLDVGCGVGTFTYALGEHYPNSTFVGLENSQKALDMARANTKHVNVTNVSFVYGNAQAMPEKWTGCFDLVFVFDVLHDLPDPHKCLGEVYRVLKPAGGISLVEQAVASDPLDNKGNALAAMYYTTSMFVCLPSSMSEEPHVGYGACWGFEETHNALIDQGFQMADFSRTKAVGGKVYYYCTKDKEDEPA